VKLRESVQIAGSVRSLTEGSHDALSETLRDFALLSSDKVQWVLCGGLAVGFRARPRGTDDVDVLVQEEADLSILVKVLDPKFKRTRLHAFTHRTWGVEVEVLTPSFLKLDPQMVQLVLADALKEPFKGALVPVASAASLIALKLGRASHLDLGDVERIVERNGPLDLSAYPLSDKQRQAYQEILNLPKAKKEDPI